jgi:hypothetical protein
MYHARSPSIGLSASAGQGLDLLVVLNRFTFAALSKSCGPA